MTGYVNSGGGDGARPSRLEGWEGGVQQLDLEGPWRYESVLTAAQLAPQRRLKNFLLTLEKKYEYCVDLFAVLDVIRPRRHRVPDLRLS